MYAVILPLEPINIFFGVYKTDNAPIRLSYHGSIHYNSVVDPYKATVGVGLGLAGHKPGVQLISAAFEHSVLHVWEMYALESVCVLHYGLWGVQTINFPYTQHGMFKRNCMYGCTSLYKATVGVGLGVGLATGIANHITLKETENNYGGPTYFFLVHIIIST